MKKAYLLIIGILLTVAGISAVNSNPSQFGTTFASDTGSTLASPTYTLAQKATSTVTIYNTSSPASKYDKALIEFQVTSTTTPPVVRFALETSINGSTWYSYDDSITSGTYASTTFSFTFASTTHSTYNNSGDETKLNGSFTIDIPAPYTRVRAYSIAGNPAYNIFIQAKPIREIQ
jgi:hypothetical protein